MSKETSTKRKDTYELVDKIRSANEKGKIYIDEELQILNICKDHDELLPCKYCKTLEHFDNCPIYKKHNQCVCLLVDKTPNELDFIPFKDGIDHRFVDTLCDEIDDKMNKIEITAKLLCGFCEHQLSYFPVDDTYECNNGNCDKFVSVKVVEE